MNKTQQQNLSIMLNPKVNQPLLNQAKFQILKELQITSAKSRPEISRKSSMHSQRNFIKTFQTNELLALKSNNRTVRSNQGLISEKDTSLHKYHSKQNSLFSGTSNLDQKSNFFESIQSPTFTLEERAKSQRFGDTLQSQNKLKLLKTKEELDLKLNNMASMVSKLTNNAEINDLMLQQFIAQIKILIQDQDKLTRQIDQTEIEQEIIGFLQKNMDLISQFLKILKCLTQNISSLQSFQQNSQALLSKKSIQIDILQHEKMKNIPSPRFELKMNENDHTIAQFLKVENKRFESEIRMLSKKIVSLEQDADVQKYKDEIEQNKIQQELLIKNWQQRFDQVVNSLHMSQINLQSIRSQKQTIEMELTQQNELAEKYQTLSEGLEIENKYLKLQNHNYRERMLMQKEDYNTLYDKMMTERDFIEGLRTKIKTLQKKIERNQIKRSTQLSIPENSLFPDQIDMFQSIRQIFKYNNTFYKTMRHQMRGFRMDEIERAQKKQLEEKLKLSLNPTFIQIRNSDETYDDSFDISKYTFYKPSFFSLIQHRLMKSTSGQFASYQTPEMDCSFIGQLRAILDSKFNEHELQDNPRLITQFPEFVYSWLGRFQVDSMTRKIVVKQKYIKIKYRGNLQAEEDRIKFYLDLTNPYLNKLWEVITFREFLLDRCSTDEIHFYLYFRNQIFQGSQLQMHDSTFQSVCYISWVKAEKVIDESLHKFKTNAVTQVKENLKEKCVIKISEPIIDIQIVLRYLLEFYRQERIIKFKLIQELFLSCQSIDIDGKVYFDFEAFKYIMTNNFSQFSDQEKVELYRECFSVGQGFVTPEIFFAVATENNLFLRLLKIEGGFQPFTGSQEDAAALVRSNIKGEVGRFIQNNLVNLNICKLIVQELGVEFFYDRIDKLIKQLETTVLETFLIQNEVTLFNQLQTIDTLLQRLSNFLIKNSFSHFSNEYGAVILQNRMKFFDRMIKDPILLIKKQSRVSELFFEERIKRIQKHTRNRVSMWYAFINTVLVKKIVEKKTSHL